MRILAVDTSSKVASAAVVEDDKLICECTLNDKLTHSQTILPIIDNVLKLSNFTASDIDVFAVSNGPGSFTGLRIGVTTIKGLAHANNKPAVGVNTLEALAYNIPYCQHIICPIMDARREQIYTAAYKYEEGVLKEIYAPCAISLDEYIDELQKLNTGIVFLGDGVPVFKEKIKQMLGKNAYFAPQTANAQRASSVAEAAKNKNHMRYCELVPIYLRKSQAERELEEREGKKC